MAYSVPPGFSNGHTPVFAVLTVLDSTFGESDACLVVVAVFKTAAPTLCAGG
jgi:hypothetical protein